jgi:hypothetical protein
MLGACGGGGDGDGAVGAAGGAVQAAQTTVVERIDPIVQSAKPATMKLAERKCARRARTEAGDGAARKALRQSARKQACEADALPESSG